MSFKVGDKARITEAYPFYDVAEHDGSLNVKVVRVYDEDFIEVVDELGLEWTMEVSELEKIE